jgi:hypothetical protein
MTLVVHDENAPHVAVVWLTYEIHEQTVQGELRGMPREKGKRILRLEGRDRSVCLNQLHTVLDEMAKYGKYVQ